MIPAIVASSPNKNFMISPVNDVGGNLDINMPSIINMVSVSNSPTLGTFTYTLLTDEVRSVTIFA